MTRFQSGIPFTRATGTGKANGLLLRGVVFATYVTDDAEHPMVERGGTTEAAAVYCDVLVYPSLGGKRFFGLKQVLVSQDIAGLHRGRIWKPRAAKLDWTDTLDLEGGSNPAFVDGDHVLVGFMNDSLSQPIILRSLPHPSMDLGRETRNSGQRMKLKRTDGDPDFIRHHGTHYGVDNSGNFVVDSTWANDGTLTNKGKEQNPPTDGKGGQTRKLPKDAAYSIVLYDMSNPDSPNEVMSFLVDKDKVQTKITQGNTIKVEEDEADALLTLGDGAVKVAVADHLETMWGLAKTAYDGHKHPSGTGPTGIPDTPLTSWDGDINSSQLLIPDTK